jgi:hypothetical protein
MKNSFFLFFGDKKCVQKCRTFAAIMKLYNDTSPNFLKDSNANLKMKTVKKKLGYALSTRVFQQYVAPHLHTRNSRRFFNG